MRMSSRRGLHGCDSEQGELDGGEGDDDDGK
jgi:hypothetical protein